MYAEIHKEMAYRIVSDFNPTALKFLLNGIAKPEWGEDDATKISWLKEWMDMPDSSKHSSKMKNDHSYKVRKIGSKFKIDFAKTGDDQATVVARLKYSARDIKEWKEEEEYRVCALELAKSIHWVVDVSSPSHTCADWDDVEKGKYHSKSETDFDSVWKTYYEEIKPNLKTKKRSDEIKDIYRWAKKKIELNYDRNLSLLEIYKNKGSVKKEDGKTIGLQVLQDLAQNLIDYLAFIDKKINFEKCEKLLPK